jgi:thiol:disulfide interchange protein DsbD
VARELERFILVKLDFTKRDPRLEKKRLDYGVSGLPTVIFMDPQGREIRRFSGFRGPEEVLVMLREITT